MRLHRTGTNPVCAACMALSTSYLHQPTSSSSPWVMLPAFHFSSVSMGCDSGLPQPPFQCVAVSWPFGIWTYPTDFWFDLDALSAWIVPMEALDIASSEEACLCHHGSGSSWHGLGSVERLRGQREPRAAKQRRGQ